MASRHVEITFAIRDHATAELLATVTRHAMVRTDLLSAFDPDRDQDAYSELASEIGTEAYKEAFPRE